MSKGSKRRPGEGYDDGYDRIFRKTPKREEPETKPRTVTLETLRRISRAILKGNKKLED